MKDYRDGAVASRYVLRLTRSLILDNVKVQTYDSDIQFSMLSYRPGQKPISNQIRIHLDYQSEIPPEI